MENKSLKSLIKHYFIESVLSLNAYGLPKIFKANTIGLKVLWSVCFIISLSYCITQIVQLVQNYLTFSVHVTNTVIKEIPTNFPAVTICNMKFLNITRSAAFLSPYLTKLQLNLDLFLSPLIMLYNRQYAIKLLVNNNPNLTNEARKALGYQIEDMLVSCYFNYEICTADDFTYSYSSSYGNCYTFNGGGFYTNGTEKKIKNVSLAGADYGLTLELFVANPSIDSFCESEDGIYLSINNQTTVPFSKMDVIKASSGSSTDFIVRRNFITKMPSPYSNCLADTSNTSTFTSFYYDYIVKTLRISYSEELCFSYCIQNTIMKSCGCANGKLPLFLKNFTHMCWNDTEKYCLIDIVSNFGSYNYSSECKSACPFECQKIDYNVQSYRSLFPTEFYSQVLYNFVQNKSINISYNQIPKAFVKVQIYYHSMEYETTTESESILFATLFSNLFGTINFYTGMNIYTIVEIVEFAVGIIIIIIHFLKKVKKIENAQVK
jgi:hypothetical protein